MLEAVEGIGRGMERDEAKVVRGRQWLVPMGGRSETLEAKRQIGHGRPGSMRSREGSSWVQSGRKSINQLGTGTMGGYREHSMVDGRGRRKPEISPRTMALIGVYRMTANPPVEMAMTVLGPRSHYHITLGCLPPRPFSGRRARRVLRVRRVRRVRRVSTPSTQWANLEARRFNRMGLGSEFLRRQAAADTDLPGISKHLAHRGRDWRGKHHGKRSLVIRNEPTASGGHVCASLLKSTPISAARGGAYGSSSWPWAESSRAPHVPQPTSGVIAPPRSARE